MSRGKSWAFICAFVVLVIAITGICLAVTPVAASFPQTTTSTPHSNTLANTLHDQGPALVGAPSDSSLQPSADACLLCYSPSHKMLARLSGWMGK